MKRNISIKLPSQNNIEVHKKRIAYHEAGHAVAILVNNELKQLPPVFFKITINGLFQSKTLDRHSGLTKSNKYSAKVDGGRLVKNLPESIDSCNNTADLKLEKNGKLGKELLTALEADVVNLLIGPLAEAKHVANSDDEVFNQYLVNVEALHNYGGTSDLALINDYLACISNCKNTQDQKLIELHLQAFAFIDNTSNWKRIIKLAQYIIDKDIKSIDYNEVTTVLNMHKVH